VSSELNLGHGAAGAAVEPVLQDVFGGIVGYGHHQRAGRCR
jgi:hypothetical protein